MATATVSPPTANVEVRDSWVPMIVIAMGQMLMSFNVAAIPVSMDVGSLRGVTQNLAAAVGTALVGALLVGLLGSIIVGHLADNPVISAELKNEKDLTNLNFFSDTQLKERLANTSATPEQFAAALHINAEARTLALKIGFLLLSGLALLALGPCCWLPNYRPGEVPRGQQSRE
jgi:hypothetical protein